MDFDWNNLAFGNKKPISGLHATFIAAPRQLSTARFKQLIKTYLPQGNIVLGLAKEDFVDGLSPNPAFRMLARQDVQTVIDLVNRSSKKHRIYCLHYFQRDLPHILDKISFNHVVLVRGSWHTVFHGHNAYYVLANKGTSFTYTSPFANEAEAQQYSESSQKVLCAAFPIPDSGSFTAEQMLTFADTAAQHSLDYSFQTGAVFGRKSSGGRYQLLAWSYNKVVPYQTYAMHHGNTREDNYSPPNDINHYDAIHAEMNLLVSVARNGIDIRGATLFINLLPCPTCAKVLSQTDIEGVMYRHDHSAGYATRLFAATGKSIQGLEPATH